MKNEFGDYSGPITIKLKPEMLSDNDGNKSDGLTYTTETEEVYNMQVDSKGKVSIVQE